MENRFNHTENNTIAACGLTANHFDKLNKLIENGLMCGINSGEDITRSMLAEYVFFLAKKDDNILLIIILYYIDNCQKKIGDIIK